MKALTASIKFTTNDHVSIKEHANTIGLTLAEFVREACTEKIERVEAQQIVKKILNEHLSKVEDAQNNSAASIETAKRLGDINSKLTELNTLTSNRLAKVDNSFIAFGNKLMQENVVTVKEINALKAEVTVLKSMNKEIYTLLKANINDK